MSPTLVDPVQVRGSNKPDAMLTRTFLSSNDLCAVPNYHPAVDYTLTVESPIGIQPIMHVAIAIDASLSHSYIKYGEYLKTHLTLCL